MMRILFIGTGDIGVPALRALMESAECSLVGVVTQPDKPVGRHQELQASEIKVLAMSRQIPVFQPARIREKSAIEQIQALNADLFVVMAYGQILPREVLAAPRLACINLHASLLPRHRGASPVQAAIEAGDAETGVTVMYVDEGLDTGDILLSKSLPIRRRETGGTLHDRLAEIAPVALREALVLLEQGSAPRIPQTADQATYARKLSRENGEIHWEASQFEIDRKIRAMNPWPAAYTFVPDRDGNQRKLKVFTTILNTKHSGNPGEILRADKDGILVATGQGALLLREVQIEGRKRMSARDFLLGHPVPVGTMLGQL